MPFMNPQKESARWKVLRKKNHEKRLPDIPFGHTEDFKAFHLKARIVLGGDDVKAFGAGWLLVLTHHRAESHAVPPTPHPIGQPKDLRHLPISGNCCSVVESGAFSKRTCPSTSSFHERRGKVTVAGWINNVACDILMGWRDTLQGFMPPSAGSVSIGFAGISGCWGGSLVRKVLAGQP